jgi:hypothetical protein
MKLHLINKFFKNQNLEMKTLTKNKITKVKEEDKHQQEEKENLKFNLI